MFPLSLATDFVPTRGGNYALDDRMANGGCGCAFVACGSCVIHASDMARGSWYGHGLAGGRAYVRCGAGWKGDAVALRTQHVVPGD